MSDSYIIRTSKNDMYRFFVKNDNLIVERFQELKKINTYTFIKDILDYSVCIDKDDKIYVIYLTSKGNLIYADFNNNLNSIEVLHSIKNMIKYSLKVIAIDSIMHVFFAVKNEKRNFVYHYYLNSNKWVSEKAAEINYEKYNCSYFLDCFKKDIYLFYCRNVNTGEYAVRKYNISNREWDDFDNNIVIKDISNLNFIISPNGTAVVYFNKIIKSNAETYALYKDFNSEASKWKYINISENSLNTLKPIIIWKNNFFYYMWNSGMSTFCKRSSDLINWNSEFEVTSKEADNKKIIYLSNFSKDKDLKINIIYFTYLKAIAEMINPKLSYSYKSLSVDNLANDVNDFGKRLKEFVPMDNRIIENNDFYIHKLHMDINNKNKVIEQLNKVIGNYEIRLKNLEEKNIEQNCTKPADNNYYEIKLLKLSEEMDNLIKNKNEKIIKLLNILEEKEKIIAKFYDIFKLKK